MTTRILHVECNEDNTVGGSHRALFDLVRSHDRSRYEPVVLFYRNNSYVDRLRALGIQVLVYERERANEAPVLSKGSLPAKLVVYLASVWRRARLLRRERIGLVHLNNSPHVGADQWWPAARLAGIPCVAFAMGIFEQLDAWPRFFARRLDHVIVISDAVAAHLRGLGVREERMSRVYLGVDFTALQKSVASPRDVVRSELGVGRDEVLAVMMGNIRHWKGQHVLLDALQRLPSEVMRRLQVLIIGSVAERDREYAADLERTAQRPSLGGRVRFPGWRDDVATLLAAADIAVHASIAPEPFGLVVPEAMGMGAAVVASREGGPGEILTPESGRTFDPARPETLAVALAELVEDPALRARLGVAARQRAQAFCLEPMVAGVTAVYDRMLASQR